MQTRPKSKVITLSTGPREVGPSSDEARRDAIEKAAYFRAQARGFEPGHELDDWVAAEHEFEQTAPGTH